MLEKPKTAKIITRGPYQLTLKQQTLHLVTQRAQLNCNSLKEKSPFTIKWKVITYLCFRMTHDRKQWKTHEKAA